MNAKNSGKLTHIFLALIVILGGFLRLSHMDLLEFKGDEAVAVMLAQKLLRGDFVGAGLMSSVGVTNPPLFIYVLAPIVAVTGNPVGIGVAIALLNIAAIVICFFIGKLFYNERVGLLAAALFAVSPWAVIYSRKIWAQDFVPLLATATMLAVHGWCVAGKKRDIFWSIFLPICVAQIHFSGLALTAAVVVIIAILRPRVDWKYAVGGILAALVVAIPYFVHQSRADWSDFRQLVRTVGGQKPKIPAGMTVRPDSGYPLPQRNYVWQAMAIQNSGQIDDLLGLSAPDFEKALALGDGGLAAQRILFAIAIVFLAVRAVKKKLRGEPTATILVLWTVVPLVVFWLAGLWTYMSYFVILYPAHFLAVAVLTQFSAEQFRKWFAIGAVYAVFVVILAWNVAFVRDFYAFVDKNGGAHGSYGTVLRDKLDAARWLAARADVKKLMEEQRLLQMDHFGQFSLPQQDLPYLTQSEAKISAQNPLPQNVVVVVVDKNRVGFSDEQWKFLDEKWPQHVEFGALRLYLAQRNG
jgi:hypothetical protein